MRKMPGHYENFPETVHGFARFIYKASAREVQQAIVSAFHRLNGQKCRLEEIVYSSKPNCEVDFELGVGEDVTFTFLDKDESERLVGEIARKEFTFLDFLCVLQYHVVDESGRRAPLKFDYHLLRFAFGKNLMELLVSHERGPQHVHVEDLMGFLVEHVKRELAEHYSVTLKLEERWTV